MPDAVVRFRRSPVDAGGGILPHGVGDMGIDVQCGGGRHMADDGGQRLDVHAMFQRVGGEGMPQVVKADVLAVRPIQNLGQLLPDGGWVQWGVLLFGEGNIHLERILCR